MVIKNLTASVQEIKVRELRGDDREFSVFIQPLGSTDLNKLVILNKEELGNSIEIVGETQKPEIKPEPKEETKVVEENVEESTPEVSEGFICDICGAEFASARSLNAHKNKAHAE